MSVFVWGVFEDSASAQKAVEEVIEASFPPEEISVVTRDPHGRVEKHRPRHKTLAPLGALVGAVFGALAMVAALSIPDGFSGPTSDLIQLAGAAALMGAIAGVYGGLYWWRKEADVPDEAFARGDVVVGVTVPEERVTEAQQSVQRAGASQVGVSETPPRR